MVLQDAGVALIPPWTAPVALPTAYRLPELSNTPRFRCAKRLVFRSAPRIPSQPLCRHLLVSGRAEEARGSRPEAAHSAGS